MAAWNNVGPVVSAATKYNPIYMAAHIPQLRPLSQVFVIALAKDHDLWEPLIRQENATWGDLVLLDHIEENRDIANTIKPIEFYKHLVHKHEAEGGEPRKFISKIDDDPHLDATTLYNEFLLPRLKCNDTIIARYLNWAEMTKEDADFPCPGGQFYTMSWDIVEILARLHTENPIQGLMEDGMPLEKPNLGSVEEITMAVNPHKMKKDKSYLRVAALFDEHGFKNSNASG